MLIVIALGFFEHSQPLSAYSYCGRFQPAKHPCFTLLKDFLTKNEVTMYPRSLHPDNVQKILIFPLHFPSCPSLKSTYCLFLVRFIPSPVLREIPFLFGLRHSNTPAPQMVIGIAYSNRKKNPFMDDIFYFILLDVPCKTFIIGIIFPLKVISDTKLSSGLFLLVHWTAVLPEKKEKIIYQSKTSGESLCSLSNRKILTASS